MKEIAILAQMNSKYVTRFVFLETVNLCRYFGSYIKGSQLWIVMEYCGGASCADMMKPDFIPEGYIAIILREVLLGLAYLHSEGKIHRDIKGDTPMMRLISSCQFTPYRVGGSQTCGFRRVWTTDFKYD